VRESARIKNSGTILFIFFKRKVNIQVNNVQMNDRWLTLQEASKVTGIKIPTLRQGIKRGKYSGERQCTPNGHRWVISLDSVKAPMKLDKRWLNVRTGEQCSDIQHSGEQTHAYSELLMKQQSERIGEQSKHISTLEKLLTDFQARISNIEAEKDELQGKLKLLPAPVEMVTTRLDELEQKIREKDEALSVEVNYREQLSSALHEQEARLIYMQSELEAEQQKPWWKKLFKK
jgi:predicted DNA-binding transcriptional regulator AlpA